MARVALASGLTLEYDRRGADSGPVVVLVPGPTDAWRSYEPVLDRLPAGIDAIAVTPRGHGGSDKPESGYAVSDFAADVVELLDAFGIARPVLAGHSGSCLVVRRVAIDHPDRVAGIVLEACPTALGDDAGLRDFVETVIAGLEDPIAPDFARGWLADTSTEALVRGLLDQLVGDVLQVPARVWKEMFAALLEHDDRAELGAIAAPALLLWGDADALVPRAMQDELLAAIDLAELVVLPGIGHTPRWEDPARFTAELARFAQQAAP